MASASLRLTRKISLRKKICCSLATTSPLVQWGEVSGWPCGWAVLVRFWEAWSWCSASWAVPSVTSQSLQTGLAWAEGLPVTSVEAASQLHAEAGLIRGQPSLCWVALCGGQVCWCCFGHVILKRGCRMFPFLTHLAVVTNAYSREFVYLHDLPPKTQSISLLCHRNRITVPSPLPYHSLSLGLLWSSPIFSEEEGRGTGCEDGQLTAWRYKALCFNTAIEICFHRILPLFKHWKDKEVI